MTTNIATTKEQSARLLQCGVDPETADMSIRTITEPYLVEDVMWHTPELKTLPYSEAKVIYGNDEITPAWSLSALLPMLPSKIEIGEDPYDEIQEYGLLIYPFMGGWQIDYQYCIDDECHSLKCIHSTDIIEVCVKAIEWLTANNYKLNHTQSK